MREKVKKDEMTQFSKSKLDFKEATLWLKTEVQTPAKQENLLLPSLGLL